MKAQSKSVDLLDLDDLGLPEAASEEPIGSAVELVLDEQFEKLEVRQRGACRLGESSGKCLGHAGQAQVSQLAQERGHSQGILQSVLVDRADVVVDVGETALGRWPAAPSR